MKFIHFRALSLGPDGLGELPPVARPTRSARRPCSSRQSFNTRVCGCQKPTVLTKCSMENWFVSIIQTAAALRTVRTRRVTPTGPAHRASRSASPSDVMFAKACDLLWGREQDAGKKARRCRLSLSRTRPMMTSPKSRALHPAGRAASSRRCTALSRRVRRRVRRLPRLLRPGSCPTSP